MTISPAVQSAAASTRTEAQVLKLRELHRARLRALDAYNAAGSVNAETATEDERIDNQMARDALWKAFEEACAAIAAFERDNKVAA